MPLYFFDLDNLDTTMALMAGHDQVGTEFEDAEAARQAALHFLPVFAQGSFRAEMMNHHTLDLQVRDESGQVFYRVRLVLSGHWQTH